MNVQGFKVGDLVDITVKGARVTGTGAMTINAEYAIGEFHRGNLAIALDGDGVLVARIATAECKARRPERGDGDCNGTADFEVVFRSSDRSKVLDRTRACLRHALAEADRAAAAGSMAQVDIEPAGKDGAR